MGKGDNRRPGDDEAFRRNYDRIFGQRAPWSDEAPWDDEVMDREMECLDCMGNPCRCDYERMEDEYRD